MRAPTCNSVHLSQDFIKMIKGHSFAFGGVIKVSELIQRNQYLRIVALIASSRFYLRK